MVSLKPLNETVKEGGNAEFYCSATGVGESYFEYQWILNREPISQREKFHTINNVSINTTGDYTCLVRNKYGDIGQSEKATLILSGNNYIKL